jgi:phytanoyl-CoA hydroxylase
MEKHLFKRLKFAYSVYNLFHRAELRYNEELYKKLGLKKRYFSPVSSNCFVGLDESRINATQQKEQNLASCRLFNHLAKSDQENLLAFEKNGCSIIKNFISEEQADEVNGEIDSLLKNKQVKFSYGNKIRFAFHVSPVLQKIANNPDFKQLLGVLLGGDPVLFQSTNFITGSEQASHSDSIHFTTYPLGGLIAVWIALEDITTENGPLHYYPGSHKLPYYLNADYGNEGTRFFIGRKSSADYEEMIRKKIAEQQMEQVKFLAKKGDLLLWHANLVHGGDAHQDKTKTRKSVVFHYFKENTICYHEITQRPALIKRQFG